MPNAGAVPERYKWAFTMATHWATFCVAFVSAPVALIIYVVLRLRHMQKLYKSIPINTSAEKPSGGVDVSKEAIPTDRYVDLGCP